MDNLSRDAVRMKALGYGCHYGKYKADHPEKAELPEPSPREGVRQKVCAYCGKAFLLGGRTAGARYCDDVCKRLANTKKARQRQRDIARAKSGIDPDAPRQCRGCGKEFVIGNRHASCRYCSDECKYKSGIRKRQAKKLATEGG